MKFKLYDGRGKTSIGDLQKFLENNKAEDYIKLDMDFSRFNASTINEGLATLSNLTNICYFYIFSNDNSKLSTTDL